MVNKKGLVNQVMIVLILGIVLVFIMVFFWVGSMLLPLITGTGGQLLSQIQTSVNTNNPNSELSNSTFTATNTASRILGMGETFVYMAFMFLIIGFLIMAYYVRTYPFLAFFWVFIIIGLVFVSMIVSNAYVTASQNPSVSNFYTNWGNNDLLMSNLPAIMVFIGVFGGIFLFVLASREPEAEVQQL